MPKRPALNLPRHVDLQTLRIFVAVAEQGNFKKAAAQISMVPSAVSRRIQELERVLGVQLVNRTPHAVEFTGAGQALLERAHRILKELDGLSLDMAGFTDGTRGSVRLAASVFSLMESLPDDLARFVRQFPSIGLSFQSLSSRQVIEALRKKQIDVGVFAASAVPTGMRAQVYRDDRLTLLVRTGHPLARRSSVGIADIAAHEVIGPLAGTETEQLLADQARRHGMRMRSSIRVASLDGMVMMAQAGFGVAIVPANAWSRFGPFRGLRRVEIHEPWAVRQLLVGMLAGTPGASPAGRLFVWLGEGLKQA